MKKEYFGAGRVVLGSSALAEVSQRRQGLVPGTAVRVRWWCVWQIRTWAKCLLPRWLELTLKEGKKKKILDRKKNAITVCQREIDRSGREGGRFLLFFCLLVSKQAFCPGQGKQKWRTLMSNLSSALFAHRDRPSLMALAVSSFLAGQIAQEWGLWKAGPYPMPCPREGAPVLCMLWGHLNMLYDKGLQISTGFKMTSSP